MAERETLDYSPEALAAHVPNVVAKDGKLWIDGIAVEEWQLTPAEWKQYFPARYYDKFGYGVRPCPICNQKEIDPDTATSWKTHMRTMHPDYFKERSLDLGMIKTWDELTVILATAVKE